MEQITLTRLQAKLIAQCLGKAIAEGAFRKCINPDIGESMLDMISTKLAETMLDMISTKMAENEAAMPVRGRPYP